MRADHVVVAKNHELFVKTCKALKIPTSQAIEVTNWQHLRGIRAQDYKLVLGIGHSFRYNWREIFTEILNRGFDVNAATIIEEG